MAAIGRWLWVLCLLLGACSAPAPAAPTSDDEIKAAVNATAAALAASAPAAPTAVLTLTVAPVAPAATATIPPASPTVAAPTVTRPPATGTPASGTPASGTPAATAGLPTASPPPAGATVRPASGTPSVPLTLEEAAYIRNVTQLIRDYNRSFDRFRELLSQVEPGDAAWRMAFSAELQLWLANAETVRAVRPPTSLATVHQRVSRGADLYQQAAQQLVRAIEATDEEQLRQGLAIVIQARQTFDEAERELGRIARERGL